MDRVAQYILRIPELTEREIWSDLQAESLEPGMGSKVSPYFILHAERICDPRDPKQNPIVAVTQRNIHEKTPPITPAPSASNTEEHKYQKPTFRVKRNSKVTIKESKRSETMKKRMDVIRENLEKSRERHEERKRLQTASDIRCEPTVIGLTEEGDLPYPMDRSVSELSHFNGNQKKANGSFPYVYFVVDNTENVIGSEETAKHSGRRRNHTSQKNRTKKETDDRTAKLQGIAREMGLKSGPMKPMPFSSRPSTRPSFSQAMFPSSIHSPPRIPPGTPATTFFSSDKQEGLPLEMEETFSGRYSSAFNGFRRSRDQPYSVQNNELPFLSGDQHGKALRVSARNHKLAEFAYMNKPQTEHRQRNVSFEESFPVIRGSGFPLSDQEAKNPMTSPRLGPRAATMGSITLQSEKQPSKSVKDSCQRLKMPESVESIRMKRFGAIPLSLPRIDIVSSVYDEMVMGILYGYIHDPSTPFRQAQLARELLYHLHQDNAKEAQLAADELIKEQENDISRQTPVKKHEVNSSPRTSRTKEQNKGLSDKKDHTIENKTHTKDSNKAQHGVFQVKPMKINNEKDAQRDADDKRQTSSDEEHEARKSVITITLKSKLETDKTDESVQRVESKAQEAHKTNETLTPRDPTTFTLGSLSPDTPRTPKPLSQPASRKSRERPIYNLVSPRSFKMAPPGLSKEDTNLSIKLST